MELSKPEELTKLTELTSSSTSDEVKVTSKPRPLPKCTPDRIKHVRVGCHMTQRECAELVYVSLRTWQNWEYGVTDMPLLAWELFLAKLGLRPITLVVTEEVNNESA